jgi:hypothetical protein
VTKVVTYGLNNVVEVGVEKLPLEFQVFLKASSWVSLDGGSKAVMKGLNAIVVGEEDGA